MKYQIVICYNKEEALKIFDQKKHIYRLVCNICNKPFYLATDRYYKDVIYIQCPHCKIDQSLFLWDAENNYIYEFQLE